jgi:hypothetical protein
MSSNARRHTFSRGRHGWEFESNGRRRGDDRERPAHNFHNRIGDTPTLTFEAQNLREAHELCHEQWLKDDLAEAKSDGVPLWDGKAMLRARIALPDESAIC